MNKDRFIGFVKLSLAHHPICWHYRPHTIRIRNVAICLGCTGFYSGVIIGIVFTFITGLYQFNWEILVAISILMFLPTILRLIKIYPFNSKERVNRFIFRWLLGFGVAVGLFSILNAPNVIIGLGQAVLGVGLYSIISYKRIKSGNFWSECQICSFNPTPDCPGLSPLYLPKRSAIKKEIVDSEEK